MTLVPLQSTRSPIDLDDDLLGRVFAAISNLPGDLQKAELRWLLNIVYSLPNDAVIVHNGRYLSQTSLAMAMACRGSERKIHIFDGGDDTTVPEADLSDILISADPLTGGVDFPIKADFVSLDADSSGDAGPEEIDRLYSLLKPGGTFAVCGINPLRTELYTTWTQDIGARLDHPSFFLTIASGQKPIDPGVLRSRVHVIIPVHNRCDMTRQCLESLKQQTLIDRMTITVVDDGSTDSTAAMLQAEFPDVAIVSGDGGLWWTGAVAKALEQLRATFDPTDFFLLVNNDALLNFDTVETLVRESEDRKRACMSSIALLDDQAVSTGWGPGTAYILNNFERQFAALKGADTTCEVDILFGRCSLFPVEILERNGNYDATAFPHYYGDSDFCLRAGKLGFRFFVTAATSIRVIENKETTGAHFDFRQSGQTAKQVYDNMTSVKSIDNVPVTWRYMFRHHKLVAIPNTAATIWRSLRQWAPIFNGLRLKGFQHMGSRPLPKKRSRFGRKVR